MWLWSQEGVRWPQSDFRKNRLLSPARSSALPGMQSTLQNEQRSSNLGCSRSFNFREREAWIRYRLHPVHAFASLLKSCTIPPNTSVFSEVSEDTKITLVTSRKFTLLLRSVRWYLQLGFTQKCYTQLNIYLCVSTKQSRFFTTCRLEVQEILRVSCLLIAALFDWCRNS